MSDNFIKFYDGTHYRPQSSDPTNPVEGDIFFSNGSPRAKGFWKYQDGQFQVLGGSGGGGLDVFFKEDHEINGIDNYTTGNNTLPDGGGTLDGTLALETTLPIAGVNSVKYTMSTSSADDYILGESVALEEKQKNKEIAFVQYYRYDGDDADVRAFLYDVSNAEEIPGTSIPLDAQAKPTRLTIQAFIKDSIDNVKIGYQITTGNNTKILIFDDIEGTSNPLVFTEIVEENIFSATIAAGGSPTVTTSNASFISGVVQDSSGVYTVSFVTGFFSVAPSYSVTTENIGATTDPTAVSVESISTTAMEIRQAGSASGAASNEDFSLILQRQGDDYFPPQEAIVNSDTGTENSFSASIAAGGSPTVTTENVSFIASVVQDSSGVYTVTFNTGHFSVIPAYSVTAENIGGTTDPVAISVESISTTAMEIRQASTASAASNEDFVIVLHRQGTDYKNPSAKAVSPLTRTAYIKDIKATTVAGGTFTQAALQTRDLNDLSGDTSFISLTTNQFTLNPGKYDIYASAPAFKVSTHQAVLYNITDSSVDIVGTSKVSAFGDDVDNDSTVIGSIDISISTTYELQHECTQTKTTDGFGSDSSLGLDEVYAQVRITKIR